jgi:hypothetical protein
MEKYRKEDSHYEDQYDKSTIKILKELGANSGIPIIKKQERIYSSDGSKVVLTIDAKYDTLTPFYTTAVWRAQHKQQLIMEAKIEDEKKDRLVMYNSMPKNVKCHSCDCLMIFCTHFFEEENAKILFVFECPKGHNPKKVLYSNGREYHFKKATCNVCGSDDIKSVSKKNKKLLTSTVTCNNCENIETHTYDLAYKTEKPISEDDRKIYCTDFIGRTSFTQDLETLLELAKYIKNSEDERKIKEEYKIDEIEKINLPQLEERLIKLTEENKFKKLQFQSPDMGRHVTVEFSIQDATDRTEKESKKLIVKILQEYLIKTNWRLVSSDNINYRLGIISGKLKAHETEEDLLMLAKQIYEGKKR